MKESSRYSGYLNLSPREDLGGGFHDVLLNAVDDMAESLEQKRAPRCSGEDGLAALKVAAAAWIYAGGAHHTSFSYAVTADHLRDFADMAGIEFLLIDENTRLEEFKKELRWNDLYYHMKNGF